LPIKNGNFQPFVLYRHGSERKLHLFRVPMPDTQENSPDQAAPPKKKGGKSLVALLLIVNLMAGAGFFFWRRSVDRNRPIVVEQPKVKEVVHLEGFVVNLADPDNHAFLRVGVDIGEYGVKKPAAEGPNPIPIMRDTILSVVSNYKSVDLLTAEGKSKLKHDLVTALQQRVPDAQIAEVYFTEFLVQQ
jgi:flagellar basal body-associated protein FliL